MSLFWVALTINAGVWDAICLASLKWGRYIHGVSAALVAVAFDSLALQSIAPHVLSAIRAGSAFASICLCQNVPSIPRDVILPAILVAIGSTVGAGSAREQKSSRRASYHALYSVLGLLATGSILIIVLTRAFSTQHLRESPARFLLPVADAAVSTIITATIASLGSGIGLYLLPVILGLGIVSMLLVAISLAFNRPQDHILISYSGWSIGLLACDIAGHYRIHIIGTLLQFAFIGAGLGLLLYRRSTFDMPLNVQSAAATQLQAK